MERWFHLVFTLWDEVVDCLFSHAKGCLSVLALLHSRHCTWFVNLARASLVNKRCISCDRLHFSKQVFWKPSWHLYVLIRLNCSLLHVPRSAWHDPSAWLELQRICCPQSSSIAGFSKLGSRGTSDAFKSSSWISLPIVIDWVKKRVFLCWNCLVFAKYF